MDVMLEDDSDKRCIMTDFIFSLSAQLQKNKKAFIERAFGGVC